MPENKKAVPVEESTHSHLRLISSDQQQHQKHVGERILEVKKAIRNLINIIDLN